MLRLIFLGGLMLVCLAAGCQKGTSKSTAAKMPPSEVTNPPKEGELTTIKLTPEAEQRLGITLAAVETRSIRQTRTYGGEVTLPTGASIVVSAPLSGTLRSPGKGMPPAVGATVKFGQPVFQLMPLLSPEREVLTPAERVRYAEARNAIATARIEAAGLVEQAQVQVEAAQIALQRAERLLREMAGTKRTVDEADALLKLNEKSLAAAKARKKQVDQIKLDDDREAGTLSALPILVPRDGIIRAEHAVAGEVVAAGAPLFEVMQSDPVWVKVPVYVGELTEIDQQAAAQVGSLSRASNTPAVSAAPVLAPPTATPLSSTVDLYYEVQNSAGQIRPGQRLGVTVPLTGDAEQRGIPWSAVVQDIHGGSWVYETTTAPHTFIRRRVQIRQVVDGWAVFDKGPPVGAKIVIEGVAEMFGAEFGFGK
ncbi:MAG: efflux RND transporter periplasmic adaptor subunit [Planctomycetales bacterium]|nr:efflux RND transporter periplasmic adaptor subunit [Planctomycetales bacterium]